MPAKVAQVRPIVQATFPNYRGRTFKIEFVESHTMYDTNWSGGTCRMYVALNFDGQTARPRTGPPWANPAENFTVKLSTDRLLVCRRYFCGKDFGITIYAHPDLKPKFLPAPERNS
jgi:hypothetical protein